MGEHTNIEWADHTFNPWIGCTKVSPGCDNCYAETLMDTRLRQVEWGPGNPRKLTSRANWNQPVSLERQRGSRRGSATRVLCVARRCVRPARPGGCA